MVAADRDTPDIGDRRKALVRPIERLGHDRHAARLQRVGGQRCHVPAFAQLDNFADVEQARVGLSDDLEPFHVIFAPP